MGSGSGQTEVKYRRPTRGLDVFGCNAGRGRVGLRDTYGKVGDVVGVGGETPWFTWERRSRPVRQGRRSLRRGGWEVQSLGLGSYVRGLVIYQYTKYAQGPPVPGPGRDSDHTRVSVGRVPTRVLVVERHLRHESRTGSRGRKCGGEERETSGLQSVPEPPDPRAEPPLRLGRSPQVVGVRGREGSTVPAPETDVHEDTEVEG